MSIQSRLSILLGLTLVLPGVGCWAGKRSTDGVNTLVASTSVPGITAAATIAPPVQPEGVMIVAFSPVAPLLATGSDNGDVVLWDVSTGETVAVRRFEHTALYIACLEFSPDGTWLAAGGMGSHVGDLKVGGGPAIYVWNVNSEELAYKLEGHSDGITDISWSPDSTRIATSSHDRTVRVWNVNTQETQQIHEGYLEYEGVSWSPEGLLAGGNWFTASIWDVESGQEIYEIPLSGALLALDFSPDGSMLAGGESWGKELGGAYRFGGAAAKGWLHIWDAKTGESVREWDYDMGVNTIAWSPDSQMVAMKTFESDVIVWDVQAGAPLYRSSGMPAAAGNIVWSADGNLIAWASGGGVSLWKIGQE